MPTTLRAEAPEFQPTLAIIPSTDKKTDDYYLCTAWPGPGGVRVEYAKGTIKICGKVAILEFKMERVPPTEKSDFFEKIRPRIWKTVDKFPKETNVQHFHTTLKKIESVSVVIAFIHSLHSPKESTLCVALGHLCKTSFPKMNPKDSQVHFYYGSDAWRVDSVLSAGEEMKLCFQRNEKFS